MVSNIEVSRTLRLMLGAGGVVALSVVVLISKPHFSRSSVLLFGSSCPCPTFHEQVTGFIVLNPLRDRAPERVASHFLSDLRTGKCNANLKLKNRRDVGNTVTLFYLFKGKFRPDSDILPGDAWGEGMVQVERLGTEWKVTNYGSLY